MLVKKIACMTALPAFPPAPTQPDTIPSARLEMYGTIPKVEPEANCRSNCNRCKLALCCNLQKAVHAVNTCLSGYGKTLKAITLSNEDRRPDERGRNPPRLVVFSTQRAFQEGVNRLSLQKVCVSSPENLLINIYSKRQEVHLSRT